MTEAEEDPFVIGEKDSEPCPAGVHPAVCGGLDIALQRATNYGLRDQWKFTFEVAPTDESKTWKLTIYKNKLEHFGEKTGLRIMLEQWRGSKFNEEEAKRFNLRDAVLDKDCQVLIVHNPKDNGGVFQNIDAIYRKDVKVEAPPKVEPVEDLKAEEIPF